MNPGNGTSTCILSGWKEIANYLGKGVRTVQRYEGDLRLPVRRPAGKARGSVVATRTEIDAWVTASPVREEFELSLSADPRYAVSMAAVRQGIIEMRELRTEMRDLRIDIRNAISLLRERLGILKVGMEERECRPTPVCELVAPIPDRERMLGLAGDLKLPKAS